MDKYPEIAQELHTVLLQIGLEHDQIEEGEEKGWARQNKEKEE